MQLKLLLTATIAATALSANAPLSAIQNVREAVTGLNMSISDWDGTYASIMPIIKEAANLATTLKTEVFQGGSLGDASSDTGRQQIKDASRGLVNDVGETIDTGIRRKPQVEAASPAKVAVLSTLVSLLGASYPFGALFTKSSPTAEDRELAHSTIQSIQNHLKRGIAAYR